MTPASLVLASVQSNMAGLIIYSAGLQHENRVKRLANELSGAGRLVWNVDRDIVHIGAR